jgi:outer membrane immunogenic protein
LIVYLIGPSRAADLPITEAPIFAPAPVASWAGVYLGGNVGYGWASDRFSDPVPLTTSTLPIDGVKGKGTLYGACGYNWQFGRLVTGAEFDFNVSDIKGSNVLAQSRLLSLCYGPERRYPSSDNACRRRRTRLARMHS